MQSIAYGIVCILFVFLLFSDTNSVYLGLRQRMVEAVFITWITTCAIEIKNKVPAGRKE
jgi:hypothetical protein